MLREDGTPMTSLQTRQDWVVYGWGSIRGKAAATTDSTGTVVFPPRRSIGFIGVRLFNRAGAFVTQCSHMLVFGNFGSGGTERWGPMAFIDVDLPPGNWMPATRKPASKNEDQLVSPYFNDINIVKVDSEFTPRRWASIHNDDPLHATASIRGNAFGFIGDTEVVLRLRKATAEEDVFIRDDPSRQSWAAYMQTRK